MELGHQPVDAQFRVFVRYFLLVFKHVSLTSALNIRFDDGGIRRRQIPFRAFVIKGYVVDFSRVAMERIHGSEIMQHMSNSMEHIHDSSWLILRPGFLAKILLEAVCIAV